MRVRMLLIICAALFVFSCLGCKEAVRGTSPPPAEQLNINTSSLPAATRGNLYTASISVSGGRVPYTFTLLSGSLPPGLSLSLAGVISGTPTTNGTYTFTIRVIDDNSDSDTQPLTIVVSTTPPPLTINTTSLPGGTVGQAYSQFISVTGGTTPYSFSITSGSLPPGLSLNTTTGRISGTPTTAGNSSFTLRVSDAASGVDLQNLTIAITGGGGGNWDITATQCGYITVASSSFTVGTIDTYGNHCVSYTYVGYWEFDLSSVPVGTTVTTASIDFSLISADTTFAFARTTHNAPSGGSAATSAAAEICPTSGSGGTLVTVTLGNSPTGSRTTNLNSSGLSIVNQLLAAGSGRILRLGVRDISGG